MKRAKDSDDPCKPWAVFSCRRHHRCQASDGWRSFWRRECQRAASAAFRTNIHSWGFPHPRLSPLRDLMRDVRPPTEFPVRPAGRTVYRRLKTNQFARIRPCRSGTHRAERECNDNTHQTSPMPRASWRSSSHAKRRRARRASLCSAVADDCAGTGLGSSPDVIEGDPFGARAAASTSLRAAASAGVGQGSMTVEAG